MTNMSQKLLIICNHVSYEHESHDLKWFFSFCSFLTIPSGLQNTVAKTASGFPLMLMHTIVQN